MNRGQLIALEGLDGCGKSTQAARIAAVLRTGGRDVVETREPTDGPVGRRIRAMARAGERAPAFEELGLFFEDRRAHVAEVIAPALEAGRWVVTDRYFLSTVAYQGARALGTKRAGTKAVGTNALQWREILARSEAEFPRPDAALLFELPVEEGLARARARGGPAEPAFERADALAAVAAIFAALDLPYLLRVDASGDPDAVTARALGALLARIGAGAGAALKA